MEVFQCKIALCLKNSTTKFLCLKTVSNKLKAFIGLTIHAKIIRGGCPLLSENLEHTD